MNEMGERELNVTRIKFRSFEQWFKSERAADAAGIPYGIDVRDGWFVLTFEGAPAKELAEVGHAMGLKMRGYTDVTEEEFNAEA